MAHIKFIMSSICTLALLTIQGQIGEFEVRKEWIGPIINNPDSVELKNQLSTYFQKTERIFKDRGRPSWHCSGNCLYMSISQDDTVLIKNIVTEIDEITNTVFKFLLNPKKDPYLSDSSLTESQAGKNYFISRGLIFIQLDSTLNAIALEAIKSAAEGVYKYKEALSFKLFGKDYILLNNEQKEELNSLVDWRLIPSNYIVVPPPPPPPPDSILIDLEENLNDKN
ncbi:hypothetical protein [Owenweeksia hongkongensis]|uniref:hypothetical protein n=1 Tax=Owenweeksia hongkongensis TaxID=253245 RepID=UPI003A928D99